MSIEQPVDRVVTCPDCLSDNEIIGSDLPPTTHVFCSHCGRAIGPWSDTRDAYVPLSENPAIVIGRAVHLSH